MATATKQKQNLPSQLDALKAFRDELRVQAHLGSIEAKQAWSAIEPHLESLIAEAAEAGVITVRAVNGVFQELKRFFAAVQKERKLLDEKRATHP